MKALAIVLLLATQVDAAGFAVSKNFIVLTPAERGEEYAELLLSKAEQYRAEIALEWFGKKLPDGEGRTRIAVDFSLEPDGVRGLTWAKDDPRRRFHNVVIWDTPEEAIGSTLKHEIAHCVMATKFPHPNRLDKDLEEGIARQYDPPEWIAGRPNDVGAVVRKNKQAVIERLRRKGDGDAN